MTARALYVIVRGRGAGAQSPLVIRDLDGPVSVTNDAEAVVEDLVAQGHLPEGRRLFYYDTDGCYDELLHAGGRFTGFRPGPVSS